MDFFLFGGNIWLGNGQFCDALLVRRGRIAAVGRQKELYPLAEGCGFIDCGGRTVIPGFYDACLCLAAACSSLPDGADGLEAACKIWMTAHPWQAKKGARLFWRSEGANLSPEQMDRLWPHAPLVLQDIAAQKSWANSAALQLLKARGIPAACAPFTDVTDDGELSGSFRGKACEMIAGMIPAPGQFQQKIWYCSWLQRAARAGITTIQSLDLICQSLQILPALRQLYREETALPRLQFLLPPDSTFLPNRPQTPEKQPSFCGKLIDFTTTGYIKKNAGQTLLPIAERQQLVQCLEHLRRHPVPDGNPRRLTLLGCAAADPRQVQELAQAGLGILAFPHLLEDSLLRCAREPGLQLENCCPWRTLQALGAKVAFGGLDRMEPFAALQKAVSRKAVTLNGESIPSKESMTRENALCAMTAGAAWTDFQEDLTGRLQPGFRADVQVLDNDYFTCDQASINKIRPLLVMSGGRILHREI